MDAVPLFPGRGTAENYDLLQNRSLNEIANEIR